MSSVSVAKSAYKQNGTVVPPQRYTMDLQKSSNFIKLYPSDDYTTTQKESFKGYVSTGNAVLGEQNEHFFRQTHFELGRDAAEQVSTTHAVYPQYAPKEIGEVGSQKRGQSFNSQLQLGDPEKIQTMETTHKSTYHPHNLKQASLDGTQNASSAFRDTHFTFGKVCYSWLSFR